MNFFDLFSRSRKANEAIVAAIQENNVQLQAITQALNNRENLERTQKATEVVLAAIQENNIKLQGVTLALNDRENPDRIREAIISGLQTGKLEKTLTSTREQLDLLNSSLKLFGSRPLSVQTFPITDNFQFEKEKQSAADYSERLFNNIASDYIGKLNLAHKPVDQAMGKFFKLVQEHIDNRNPGGYSLGQAMEGLLHCSPKRVIAAFQKHSLEAGWQVVYKFNCLIDLLAKEYPRCRSGIFASRLNYSDVIQISEEIISTLRATSTVLDDVQRRDDLLEALQGELLSDLQSPQIQQIWDAIGASFKNSLQLYAEDDSWWQKALKATVGQTFILSSWAMAIVSAPQAQFQGELARERRVRVFIATSFLLQQGWIEWSRLNQEIVIPNLTVMFNLKSDYVRNRIISIADLITTNGYSLDGLTRRIDSLVKNGNIYRDQIPPIPNGHHQDQLAAQGIEKGIVCCPNCNQHLRVPTSSSGVSVRCPSCKFQLIYGEHQFNNRGFCKKCDCEKDFLIGLNRLECAASSLR